MHTPPTTTHWIDRTHKRLGALLQLTNRALLGIVSLGVLMLLGTQHAAQFMTQPQAVLGLQGYQINYYELVKQHETNTEAKDPNWDGALAGLSIGYSLTRSYPLVIPVLGASLGMVIGYQLDNSI